MKLSITRLSLMTAVLALATVLFLPSATRADEFNLKTYITVDQPVQVPGATLQPNVKYVFRRLSADSGLNHIVRVMNADETKVIATFMTISDQRLDPADGTVLTFYETAAGYAKPIRSWFYPGRTIGMEFLYPKAKMVDIQAHLIGTQPANVQTASVETNSSVNSNVETSSNLAPAPATEETAPMPSESEQSAIAQNTEPEVQQQPTEVTPEAPASSEPESTAQNNSETQNTKLPRTAGELPLIGLLGLAALGLRVGLRRV